MAYEPTNWKAGDVVTAAKLNKMEQGIANAVLIVHDNDGVLDKTWQEIHDAKFAVVVNSDTNMRVVTDIGAGPSDYFVGTSKTEYATDSPNGFPANT
jgi:hypothetical protein